MEQTESPAPRHRLREPLPITRIPCESASPHFLGYARNVSETGLFLQCPLPPPPGTRLTLRLQLPGDGPVIEARGATVVWVREYKGWRCDPAGAGVHLASSLEDGEREAWAAFCRKLPAD